MDERIKQVEVQECSSARVSEVCFRRSRVLQPAPQACGSGTVPPELGALPPVRRQERLEAALHLHIPLQIISARLLEKLHVSGRAMRRASSGTVGRRRPRVSFFGAVRSC